MGRRALRAFKHFAAKRRFFDDFRNSLKGRIILSEAVRTENDRQTMINSHMFISSSNNSKNDRNYDSYDRNSNNNNNRNNNANSSSNNNSNSNSNSNDYNNNDSNNSNNDNNDDDFEWKYNRIRY